jgi:hypothetical protein
MQENRVQLADGRKFGWPSGVAARNGDIDVADRHGGTTNDRIVKFAKDGKFIVAWGKHGKADGEIRHAHGGAYVADYANTRIQICESGGKFAAERKRFGRPSDIANRQH